VCQEKEGLRSWEVNFAYMEKGESKNALVKLRLCQECSDKLNYHSKKREVKRLKKNKKEKKRSSKEKDEAGEETSGSSKESTELSNQEDSESIPSTSNDTLIKSIRNPVADESIWTKKLTESEDKSREDEFDEYLQDLLL
jgi:protein FRA10AC1